MDRDFDQSKKLTDEEAKECLSFADGILGMAGHEVNDPYLDEITLRFLRDEISAEEANELSKNYILNDASIQAEGSDD